MKKATEVMARVHAFEGFSDDCLATKPISPQHRKSLRTWNTVVHSLMRTLKGGPEAAASGRIFDYWWLDSASLSLPDRVVEPS